MVPALLRDGSDPNLQVEYGNAPRFAAADRNGRTSSVLETLDATGGRSPRSCSIAVRTSTRGSHVTSAMDPVLSG